MYTWVLMQLKPSSSQMVYYTNQRLVITEDLLYMADNLPGHFGKTNVMVS